ncbi:hypothetical protein [Acinetobacter beijerinckii]|uniref:hypothetical protein n=1 Tax=Acinetobacter beijerinckii TaxID=262668 RepID=UPI0040552E3A
MSNQLQLISGRINSVRKTEEGTINWFDNKLRVIKRIQVIDYQANLENDAIRFVISHSLLNSDGNVDVVAFKELDSGSYVVVALKQNQLMYLNPYLHDRAVNPNQAFNIKFWHILLTLSFVVSHSLSGNSSFEGIILLAFTVLTFSCCFSAYFKLDKKLKERKEMRQKILNFYNLPESLEAKIFNKKWRFRNAIGVVDLFKLELSGKIDH